MVQSFHIQRAKLEVGEEAYQPGEQLEEVGDMPAGEMVEKSPTLMHIQ
jgi:hypothetical protein